MYFRSVIARRTSGSGALGRGREWSRGPCGRRERSAGEGPTGATVI